MPSDSIQTKIRELWSKKSIFPRWLYIFVAQAIILNVLMAFFYGIPDYQAYMEHLSYMRRFINPYVEDWYYSKYPAGYFLFMGLLGLMGADSFWQLKLALGFFDVLNIFTCYYICKDIFKIESESRILCILVYFYNIYITQSNLGEMMLFCV